MAVRRRSVHSPKAPELYGPTAAARDARRIAENWTLRTDPIDVVGLARAIGLGVQFVPLESHLSGYLRKKGDDWVIGVNSLHPERRQRFTLAHELGHYFLHRNHGDFLDKVLFRRGDVDPKEVDANRFASYLLMPGEAVQLLRQRNLDEEQMAAHFNVSRQAMEYRLNSIEEERMFV